jgi:hypothetical protein
LKSIYRNRAFFCYSAKASPARNIEKDIINTGPSFVIPQKPALPITWKKTYKNPGILL